ncbi:NAD(P)H-dependent oxidoreductase [Rhodococcus sp. IEGM 1381]|uniref:NADPH-dependent FMN reductase n=1 Tax=Rhodococcus sp. IEGM 1381 TaxID=3047085 RepID=UPI0024B72DC5|nr:NAD(P)H-dependent oxidoreductase [Rhodococcus sp. IEGM 1381]MDI9894729.1 NAD(P)H-dependent oxidoreductase [Rhodococcus sp. IEGM 1381]
MYSFCHHRFPIQSILRGLRLTTSSHPLRLAIIAGSTRPGRHARTVADWVAGLSRNRPAATYEVIDLAQVNLPFIDEVLPPMAGQYSQPHTVAWASTIQAYDGFLFVTPEYNHAPPAVLKNALDLLFAEWNDKAATFVSYGFDGGIRAVEQLRQICGELKLADVRASLALRFGTDFEGYATFNPAAEREADLARALDDLEQWAQALRPIRHPELIA